MTLEEDELFSKAKALIKRAKEIQKTLYQLCFIATSENPLKEEAERLIKEMIDKGLVTEAEVYKAKEDVKRWRSIILDKIRW